MPVPLYQAKQTLEEFTKEYIVEPFNEYVLLGVCGKISDAGLYSLIKPFDKNKDLKPDESLEDVCINVLVSESIPQELLSKLPDEYKGIRVLYQNLGKVKIVSKPGKKIVIIGSTQPKITSEFFANALGALKMSVEETNEALRTKLCTYRKRK